MTNAKPVGQIIDRLPADVTSCSLKPLLGRVTESPCNVIVSGDRVEKMDVMGLQGLLALGKHQLAIGKSFALTDISAPLNSLFNRYGVTQDLVQKGAQ